MRKVDATQGPLIKSIFIYALPLVFTTLVQSLFSAVDTVVLGNMADTIAVASVGAVSTVVNLFINGMVGISSGTSTVLARYIGKGDKERIRATIDTSMIASVGFGILIATLGILLSPMFLRITDCPDECYSGALTYLRIYFIASPATSIYNFGAAILRSSGDTKRPMLYITISGITNAVTNIILCLILENKIVAVAIATALSKLMSGVLVSTRLLRADDVTRIDTKNMRFELKSLGKILQFGLPSAVHSMIFPIANMQIVPAINAYGVDAMAGNTAGTTVMSLANTFTSAFGITTTTFMGQNIGADNKSRTIKSLLLCLGFGVAISGVIGIFLYLTGEFWLSLILGAGASAAIVYGMSKITYVVQFIFVNAANSVLNHALQSYGYPVFVSISSIFFTLVFRIIWMQIIYPLYPTFDMIMICFIVSWTLNMLCYGVLILFITHRYKRGIYKKI